MDRFEQQERKREARRRLNAQRNRAGRLRGRVVVGSLICFALLWGVVFAQMATGNDPVLGDKSKTVARSEPRRSAATKEAIETTDPEEVEDQITDSEPANTEAALEPTPEVEVEPEPEVVEPQPEEVELEPLTTGQS